MIRAQQIIKEKKRLDAKIKAEQAAKEKQLDDICRDIYTSASRLSEAISPEECYKFEIHKLGEIIEIAGNKITGTFKALHYRVICDPQVSLERTRHHVYLRADDCNYQPGPYDKHEFHLKEFLNLLNWLLEEVEPEIEI